MRRNAEYIDQALLLVRDTLTRKDADYAGTTDETDVFDNFTFAADFAGDNDTEMSFRHDLGKKVRRLRNIFREKRNPFNEQLIESLKDLAGYAILYMAYLMMKDNESKP